MNSRKSRTKYDKNRLKQYCDENNIVLKKDYSEDKINRDTIIEANCLNCSSKTNKRFRLLISTGCFCKMCMVEKQRLKVRETQLNTGNAKDYLKLILEITERYNCTDVSINGKQINEYRNNEIHRDLEIDFTCACGEYQHKPVRDFVELTAGDADGGKCRNCIAKLQHDKLCTTSLELYGCKYPIQNVEIFEKQQNSCFKTKEYIFANKYERAIEDDGDIL